jgi:hypothetical protein
MNFETTYRKRKKTRNEMASLQDLSDTHSSDINTSLRRPKDIRFLPHTEQILSARKTDQLIMLRKNKRHNAYIK